MSKIYLVGFMGVGKSTVGKKLAKALDYAFVDLDDLFENTYKISIDSFFGKYGEKLFRDLEYRILESTFGMENTVISTGGGTPCQFDSMDKMNENGLTVYLEMSGGAIVQRLSNAKRKRPLVSDKQIDELSEFVSMRLKERSPYYQKSKIRIAATNLNLDELLAKINKELT